MKRTLLLGLCILIVLASASLVSGHTTNLTSGVVGYATGTNPEIVKYRTWNGTNVSAELNDNTLAGTAEWIILRSSPRRQQQLRGVVYQNAGGTTGIVSVATFEDGVWSSETNLSTAIGTTNDDFRGLDIKYFKDGSGRAMAVFNNNTANAGYAIWNGSAWTEFGTITADNCTGTTLWIEMASGANGTMYQVDLDANGDFCAHAWNGTHWNATRTLQTATTLTATKAFAVESESLSGDGLAVWEGSTAGVMQACQFDLNNGSFETGWCNTIFSMGDVGVTNELIQMASDPVRNAIAIASYEKAQADVNAIYWNGSTFGAAGVPTTIDASVESAGDGLVDVAFIGETGKVLLVTNDANADDPFSSTCASVAACDQGTWAVIASTGMTNCGEVADLDFVGLKPDPFSDHAMLTAVSQNNHFKCVQEWNGTTWLGGFSGLGSGVANALTYDADFAWNAFIDNTAPVVKLIAPVNGSALNTTLVTFQFNVTDDSPVSQCNLTLNGTSNQSLSDVEINTTISFTTLTLNTGNYSWNVTCRDKGNQSGTSGTFKFSITVAVDTLKPNVTDIRPLAGTQINVTENITISANVTDDTAVSAVRANITFPNGTSQLLTLGLATGTIYNASFRVPALLGRYNVTILANDTSMNLNNTNGTFFFGNDTVIPVINGTAAFNSTFGKVIAQGGGINISANASDLHSGVNFTEVFVTYPNGINSTRLMMNCSGSPLTLCSFNWSKTTQIGQYLVRVQATDFANQTSSFTGISNSTFNVTCNNLADNVCPGKETCPADPDCSACTGLTLTQTAQNFTIDNCKTRITVARTNINITSLSFDQGVGQDNKSVIARPGDIIEQFSSFLGQDVLFLERSAVVYNTTKNVSSVMDGNLSIVQNDSLTVILRAVWSDSQMRLTKDIKLTNASAVFSSKLTMENIGGSTASNVTCFTYRDFDMEGQQSGFVTRDKKSTFRVSDKRQIERINDEVRLDETTNSNYADPFYTVQADQTGNKNGGIFTVGKYEFVDVAQVKLNDSEILPFRVILNNEQASTTDIVEVYAKLLGNVSAGGGVVCVTGASSGDDPSAIGSDADNFSVEFAVQVSDAAVSNTSGKITTLTQDQTFNTSIDINNLGTGNKSNLTFTSLIYNASGTVLFNFTRRGINVTANTTLNDFSLNSTSTFGLLPGNYTVTVEFYELGVLKDSSTSSFIIIDSFAPNVTNALISPTLPLFKTNATQNITVNFTSTEYPINLTFRLFNSTGALVNLTGPITINSPTQQPFNYTIPGGLADGTYHLNLTVQDSTGNSNLTFLGNITIDSIKPNVTNVSTGPPLPLTTNGTARNITVNYTSSEFPVNLTFTLYNATGSAVDTFGPVTVNVSGVPLNYTLPGTLAEGNYSLNLTTLDRAGNANVTNLGNISVNFIPGIAAVTPITGSNVTINGTIAINASINATDVSTVYATVTFPNGTMQNFTLVSAGGGIYSFNFTNLTLKGQYNITITANDTIGQLNTTAQIFFTRITYAFNATVDILFFSNDNPINATTTVLANSSGVLAIEAVPVGHRVKRIVVFNHTEGSPYNLVRVENVTNDAGFDSTWAIDLSGINATHANVTFTVAGTTLWKCPDFNRTSLTCTGGWEELRYNLTPGSNITLVLNATDPGFGDGSPDTGTPDDGIFDAFGDGFSSTVNTFVSTQTDNAAYFAVRRNNGAGASLDLQAWLNLTYNLTPLMGNVSGDRGKITNMTFLINYCHNDDITGGFTCGGGAVGGAPQNPLKIQLYNWTAAAFQTVSTFNASDSSSAEFNYSFNLSGRLSDFINATTNLTTIRYETNISITVSNNDAAFGVDYAPLTVTFDLNAPNWSNNVSFPSSPVIYFSNSTHQFNVTWTENASSLDKVIIEHNFTGTLTNVTLTGVGSVFNFTFGPIGAGGYVWKHYANDTAGNLNVTNTFEYVVQKATPALNITATPSDNVTYGTTTTVSCTANNSQVTVQLYRNGTAVVSPDIAVLAAGVYNYSCNTTGNQNFTTATTSINVTVNKAAASTNLTLNGTAADRIVELGSFLLLNGTLLNGTGNLDLIVNGTVVASGASPLEFNQNFSGIGVYNVSVRVNESQNFTANVTTYFVTSIENGTPVVTLINPLDFFNTSNATLTLNWTVTDNFDTSLNCTVRVNNTETNVSVASPNGTNTSVNVVFTTNGTRFWNVTCSDDSGNVNTSLTRRFTIDQVAPNWSNNISFPSSPVIYASTSTHQFNVTWSDSLTAIHTVLIEHNFTGTLTNTTLTAVGSVYNLTFGPLAAGGYTWRQIANDTVGNKNTTLTFEYVVQQATPALNITATPSDTVIFGTTTSVSCTANNSQVTVQLYRNGTAVVSPDIAVLAAGVYNYSCNTTGNQNFTTATTSINLTVNKATADVNLTLNDTDANVTIDQFTSINLTAVLENGTGNIDIFRNGTLIESGSSPVVNLTAFNQAGLFNITARVNESQNFTAAFDTHFVTVRDKQAPNWSNNVSFPSSPVIYFSSSTHQFNVTWSDNTQLDVVLIEHNFTGTLTNVTLTGVGAVYNFTFGPLAAGGYAWKHYANDTAGNLNITNTFEYVVQQANSTLNLSLNGSTQNRTLLSGATISINATLLAGQGVIELFRNGTLINSGTSPLGNLSTFTGTGIYNITVRYNATQNFTTNFSTLFVEVVDNRTPNVTLIAPLDFFNTSNTTVTFNWTVTDDLDTSLNCTVRVNNTETNISVASPNGTNTSVNVVFTTNGTRFWNVTCADDYSNVNTSLTRRFTIDQVAPAWTNNISFPSSPVIYASTSTHQFNITWTDTLTAVHTVLIEHNFTGTLTNTTLTAVGSVYNLTFGPLAAGGYTWRQIANDTVGNKNTTNTFEYVVQQATPNLNITARPSDNVTFGTTTNITCSVNTTQLNVTLRRNGTIVNSTDIAVLAAGVYNYTCNSTGNQNFTSTVTTINLTVNRAAAEVNLLINGVDSDTSAANGSIVNFTAILVNGTGNIDLFRNGTLITSGASPLENLSNITIEGIYNITARVNESQNFTAAFETHFLTIVPPTAIAPNITLTAPPNNTQFNNTRSVLFNYTATDDQSPSFTCRLFIDGVLNTTNVTTNNTPTTVNVTTLQAGNHTWSVNCTDGVSENVSGIRNFSIADSAAPNWSNNVSFPSSPVIYASTSTHQFNVTWSDLFTFSVVKIEHNFTGTLTNVTLTGVNSTFNFTFGPLAAGGYIWRHYANDTSGNLNITNTFEYVVQRATPALNITALPGDNVTFGTTTNVSCTVNNTQVNITLQRNGTVVSNPHVAVISAGVHNYTCNTTGNQNFTSAIQTINVTVNKAAAVVNLTLNGTQGNVTISAGQSINLTATIQNGTGDIDLLRNGTTIASGASPQSTNSTFSTLGLYNITARLNESQNFTRTVTTHFVTVVDATAPSTLVLAPTAGSTFFINGTVNITANVTDNIGVDTVIANVTLPNGTVLQVPMTLVSGTIYTVNFTNLTLKGQYNITIVANDTAGNLDFTGTTNISRVSFTGVPFDVVRLNNSFVNFTMSVLSNISGIVTFEVLPVNHTIKRIVIFNYTEGDPRAVLRIENRTRDAGFRSTYVVDASMLNASFINVTVTANGTTLWKCVEFSSANTNCTGGWEEFRYNLTVGQNYTFTLNATDPGFGDGSPDLGTPDDGVYDPFGDGFSSSVNTFVSTQTDNAAYFAVRRNNGAAASLDLQAWLNLTYNLTPLVGLGVTSSKLLNMSFLINYCHNDDIAGAFTCGGGTIGGTPQNPLKIQLFNVSSGQFQNVSDFNASTTSSGEFNYSFNLTGGVGDFVDSQNLVRIRYETNISITVAGNDAAFGVDYAPLTVAYDAQAPNWSNNVSFPASPATYSTTGSYQFNVTWSDNHTAVSTVLIEHNFTGTLTNTTLAAVGSVYNLTFGPLAAGGYIWRQHANDTVGNKNTTFTFEYVVQPANSTLNLSLNGTNANRTILPGASLNINASLITAPQGNLELFLNGTLINSGTSPLGNLTTFATIGLYNITVRYNATQNFTANFTTLFVNVVDNQTPTVVLRNPPDTFNTSSAVVTLNWSATNGIDSELNCTVRVNNTETNVSVASPNGTNTSVNVLFAGNGTRFWNVTCSDDSGNLNTSSTRSFTIDQVAPSWTNNISFPSSPVIYASTSTHQFNVTWSDTLTAIHTVLIEHNFTGTLTNTTLTAVGSVYNFTFGPLAAGGYTWRQIANDTVGNKNTTNTFEYVVQQATPNLNMTARPSDNVTFGTTTNITCTTNATHLNTTLRRNGTIVNSTDIASLAAGVYNYTCNSTGDQNFTSTVTTINLTVNKAAATINLTINAIDANTSATNGSIVNFTVVLVNGTGNIDLFRNGTLIASGASPQENLSNITIEGLHNITAVLNESQNFSRAVDTHFLTITPPSAVAPNISQNAPANNTAFNNTQTVTFNWTATDDLSSSFTCRLFIDGALNATNTTLNNTPTLVTVTSFTAGTHTWFVNCTDGSNVNVSGIRNVVINDTVAPNWSNNVSFPSSPVIYASTSVHQFNVTWSDFFALGVVKIEHNFTGTLTNVTLTGVNSTFNFTFGPLAAGGYVWKHYANDTSGNRNITNTFEYVVQRATPALNITALPSDNVTFGATTNVTCTANNTQVNTTLRRNGTVVSSPDVTVLAAGVYNYTCNTTGNQNFTSAIQTINVTVNKAAATINLTIQATDGNVTVQNGTLVNFTVVLVNGTGNISLFRNGTFIAAGASPLSNISNITIEGLHNITAVLNESQNFSRTVDTHFLTVIPVVPNIAPNITLNAPANNTQVNNTQTVTFNYTAIDDFNTSFFCTLSINGTVNTTNLTANNTPVLVTLTTLPYGRSAWNVNCTDNASVPASGNSTTFFFLINDTQPPSVSTVFPTNASEDVAVNFTANVSDNRGVANCSLFVNGTNNGSMTVSGALANRTVTFPQPGSYTLLANCTDTSGNVNDTSNTTVIIADVTAPTVTIVSPIATIFTNISVLINLTATDNVNVSAIFYMFNDSLGNLSVNFTFASAHFRNFSDNSTVTLRAFANDSSGNIGSASVTFSINVSAAPDNISPTITNVNVSQITNISARINWTTDEGSNSTVLYGTNSSNLTLANGSSALVTAHSIILTGLTNGTQYFFNVSSCDNAVPRNCNMSGIFNFTTVQNVDTTPPIIISQFLFPRAVIRGKTVQLTLNATDDHQLDKLVANISLPNGSVITLILNTTYTTVIEGRHNVSFYANDTAGNSVVGTPTYFIVANATNFTKNVTNASINGIFVNQTILFPGTEDVINQSITFTGTIVEELPDTLLDMLFVTHSGMLTILFRNVSLPSSSGRLVGMDLLPSPVSTYLVSYGVNNSYNITNARVRVAYNGTGFSTESNLHVDVCSSWDFINRTCLGSFSEISGASQNTTGDYFEFTVTGFSGYSIRETAAAAPSPGGGGGGGGGPPPTPPPTLPPVLPPLFPFPLCDELWQCGEWSDCAGGIRTRDCTDVNACGTTDFKPKTAEACAVPEAPIVPVPPISVVEAPDVHDLLIGFARQIIGILLIGLVIALFLALYLQRHEIIAAHDVHVLTKKPGELLVPSEFVVLADRVLDKVFAGTPDELFWHRLHTRYPPLVVRTVRLALIEVSKDVKRQVGIKEPVKIEQHYDYIGYRTFVGIVRALVRAKLVGIPVHIAKREGARRPPGKGFQVVEEYPEVKPQESMHPEKVPVRSVSLAKLEDVKHALRLLREGPGMLMVDVSGLRERPAVLKTALKLLKHTAQATNGDVLGLGTDWVIITNDIPIEKTLRR